MSSSSDRATTLCTTAHDFCHALIKPLPPDELLSRFFTPSPKITEHGPSWASSRLPFLGKTFSGKESCLEYFSLLSDTLAMKLPSDAFPAPEGFAVTTGEGKSEEVVAVVGKGRFESKKTGKGWDEVFSYRLSGFDERGRIGHWEVWADPLSAWIAVGGEGEGVHEEKDGRMGHGVEGVLDGEGYAS